MHSRLDIGLVLTSNVEGCAMRWGRDRDRQSQQSARRRQAGRHRHGQSPDRRGEREGAAVEGIFGNPGGGEAEIFGARVVDSSTEGFALEATGDPEKLDEFIDVMRSYGEIDTTRSGMVAVSLEAKKLKLQPPVLTEQRA